MTIETCMRCGVLISEETVSTWRKGSGVLTVHVCSRCDTEIEEFAMDHHRKRILGIQAK